MFLNENFQCSYLYRSMFKFFIITFGSSFLNVTLGYLRFAVESNTRMSDRFVSKMSLALLTLIVSSLATFIFFMILIQTNVVTNIIMKTFCGKNIQRCHEFFIYHFKTSLDFITLIYPPSFLFIYYVPTIIFICKRSIEQMGSCQALTLLKDNPTILFFSILTHLLFKYEGDSGKHELIEPQTTVNVPYSIGRYFF